LFSSQDKLEPFFHLAAEERQESEEKVNRRGIRIELQRSLQLRLLARQIPIQDPFGFAQIAMRLSIFVVELNRLRRGRSRSWICLERFYVNVRQVKPDFRDPGPGA